MAPFTVSLSFLATIIAVASGAEGSIHSHVLKKVPLEHPDRSASLVHVRGGGRPVFQRKKDIVHLEKKKLPKGQYSVGRMLEYHKALWLPLSLAFNYYYNNWSTRSCLASGLFGSYGINWVLKSYIFWDKTFYNEPVGIGGLPVICISFILLSQYFLYPWLAAKNRDPIQPWEIIASCILYSVGAMFHYGADAQKFFTLKYRGSGLITTGFFSKFRHPSYFGEDLIFAAFTIVAGTKNPIVWLPAAYLLFSFMTLSKLKMKSLSRYDEFDEWKKNTWF